MKSIYIEGTNKQYSIREDGEVIRHYHYSKNGKRTIIYKKHIVKKTLNKKYNKVYYSICGKQGALTVLMSKYFHIPNKLSHLPFHKVKITHKDNNPFNCAVDNLQYEARSDVFILDSKLTKKEKDTIYSKRRYLKDSDKIKKRVRNYANNNKEKISQAHKVYREKNIEQIKKKKKEERLIMTKAYVASKLGLKVSELTENIYQDYKENLSFKREISQKHNVHISTLR